MAILSSANLPDWLAQWAMNRGAIENPSTSGASSGLFNQPVIRRRRPAERMDDGSDDSWMYETSPVLDSYATSWEDVGRDLSNIPGQFMEDVSNIPKNLGELLDGASSMFKDAGESIEKSTEQKIFFRGEKLNPKKETGLLGTINQLPDTIMRGLLGEKMYNFVDDVGNKSSTGSFMRGADDTTLPKIDRVGAAVGAVAPFLIPGMGATGVGLFGGIANAMGYHHDFDPRYESNLSYNPKSERISWDSASLPGGGGHQYGALNNKNFFEANPDQYFNIDGIGYLKGSEIAEESIWNRLHEENYDNKYIAPSVSALSGLVDFGMGDQNVTNQEALAQYNFDRTGAIQNLAGSIADSRGLGYNEQQALADGLAAATRTGVEGPVAENMANIYGPSLSPEELNYMDMMDEFDQADADDSGIFGGIDDTNDYW